MQLYPCTICEARPVFNTETNQIECLCGLRFTIEGAKPELIITLWNRHVGRYPMFPEEYFKED